MRMIKLRLFILTLLFLICCCLPAQAENLPALDHSGVETQQPIQSPLKSYFLNVLAGGSRRSIKLDSPATRLIIYSQQGEMPIRCGDGMKTYDCIPGNPLKIQVDPATPIEKFWAENLYEKPVRLRIDVLEEASSQEAESLTDSHEINWGSSDVMNRSDLMPVYQPNG
ncbi:hypothetical protein [Coleofasciculus sp.]|uniref:hypothetical protein n=1 Tax=Coleofasciculus sp. TaxID=3100458 RepID=UPI0039FB397B